MNTARILQLLEAEMSAMATSALKTPSGRDAFEYGRAVGMYAGLQRAFEVVGAAHADEERAGFDL